MHMIDTSNARDNMAYVGEVPWHKLGTVLQPGQSEQQWAEAAGLVHTVKRSDVVFDADPADGDDDGEPGQVIFADKHVLYRSDTLAPLSIVSRGYNIVQPREVLHFFREMAEQNKFQLETAGALDGGKRVWALAKVNDGQAVVGHDVVRPYVLMATSYDGTMATTAKFTTIRVVCHNTLTMAAGGGERGFGQTETDENAAGKSKQVIRVPHSLVFDPKATRMELGIVLDSFERFMVEAKLMAAAKIDTDFAKRILQATLPEGSVLVDKATGERKPVPVEETKGYARVMELFGGAGYGADLKGAKGTAWGLLNAVTQYVDHERGRSDNGRIGSAWFGAGETMKNTARDAIVAELVA